MSKCRYDLSEDCHNKDCLSCMLDKIRAEIEQIIGEHNLDDYDFCSGLICARKIIDKYRNEVNYEADN